MNQKVSESNERDTQRANLPRRDPIPLFDWVGRTRSAADRLPAAAKLCAAAALALGLVWALRGCLLAANDPSDAITARVARGTLPLIITAGGELESSRTVAVVCEVEGQAIKIVEMLPEGTRVTQGQVVLQFDAAEIERNLAGQEIKVKQAEAADRAAREELKIQQNKGDSEVAKADLALTLAELDRKKFLEGEYGVELDNLKGSIALAQADLDEARATVDYYDKLVKKGFRTPEQLRAKEQEAMRAQHYLSRDQEKLRVLEKFTRERQEVELTAKEQDASREVDRARSSREATVSKARTDVEATEVTAQLERSLLDKLQKQLAHCVVRAPQDGIVVYYKEKSSRIELGAAVHFKQVLFNLPDLTQMQVKAYLHESVVKKVRPGLKAEVRIDAYPNAVLNATVDDVATFYDASRQWLSGGVKEYATRVRIDDLPDAGFKPGMSAEVKVLLGEVSNALIVPLPAVTEQQGQYTSYVVRPGGVERRNVTVGQNNAHFVVILDGLEENEQVALDARQRASAE